ncbi:uncharacterized protein P884DRAFT_300651 [Thermothelomyces heterothallicus CBS 202.75]|uniref:uncharacterized protein n=1 Tax=Thermothelomyces heterothallicus CBS 202.75 TaxID=1149848 RepID=UPI0037425B73
MTDRHASSSRTHASGVSKARSGVPSSSSVRRNLFPSQLTRRPTALSPAPEDLHSDEDGLKGAQRHGQYQPQPETPFSQDEIVARDHNGEVELGDPPTPLIDDPEDMEAIEARHEKEIEKQRLAEAVKQHRIGQHNMPAQQEELLEAVKASLRAKVAALAEDNWLYEPGPRPQRHR